MTKRRTGLSAAVGRILVASPLVVRAEYHHSVILITSIDQHKNIQGLILNRPTNTDVSEISVELSNFDFLVRDGGPHDKDELFIVHTMGSALPDSKPLFPGVYTDGDLDELSSWLMIKQVDLSELLFVSGFCKFTAAEFAAEIDRQEWYVTDGTMDIVFSDRPTELWHELVASFGKYISIVADNATRLSINN